MASGSTWRRRGGGSSDPVHPGALAAQPGPRSEVTASLPLQMALYFNIWFFPAWLAATITMLTVKLECLPSLYRFIAVTVTAAVSLIEPLRIYLGYMGNLQEKIPEAAGFWMLSVLLQLPLQTFLLVSPQLRQQPLEYVVQATMLLLLGAELVVGYLALRRAARHQAHRLHGMQTGKTNLAYQPDETRQ